MDDKIYYIQITTEFTQDNVSYFFRKQFVYTGEYKYMTTFYDTCDDHCIELHYIGYNCDGDEIFLPARYCVLTDVCIDESDVSIPEYIKNRDSDKFNDYIKMVKETLDIDMTLNYKPQYNRKYYDRIDLIVPGEKRKKNTNNFDEE